MKFLWPHLLINSDCMTEKHGFISKSISFNQIPQFQTKIPQFLSESCVELRGFWCGTEGFLVLNWGIFGVELRGFWCGTERFWGLKRSCPFVWIFCVELRVVWNWGGPAVKRKLQEVVFSDKFSSFNWRFNNYINWETGPDLAEAGASILNGTLIFIALSDSINFLKWSLYYPQAIQFFRLALSWAKQSNISMQ